MSNNTRTTSSVDIDSFRSNRQFVGLHSSSILESFVEQLCTMFQMNTGHRNRLYSAIWDKFREPDLIDSSGNQREFIVTITFVSNMLVDALKVPELLVPNGSRFYQEFQEISLIGNGGFGDVFKASYSLDGINYAVKKIVVRSPTVRSIMEHLTEVRTLASLNHPNIVSYKRAWIEMKVPRNFIPSLPFPSDAQSTPSSIDHSRSYTNEDFSIQSQSSSSNSWSSQSRKENADNSEKTNSRSEQRIVEENIASENTEESNSNSISFRNDSEYQVHKTENSTNSTDDTNKPYENYVTLYIQMALCEKTLEQWLEERIELPSQTLISGIFIQILRGLNYIHSRRIVHHDIKPSNIFISTSSDLQIRLGDFGLACRLQRENYPHGGGTRMYAAPEQLQGKCDPKSDIYSLGIVLLQLLLSTKTYMEHTEIISNLRKGQIPPALTANNWAHMVSLLVQVDPETRPSTSQLLHELNEHKNVTEIVQLLQERILKTSERRLVKRRV